MHQLRHVPPPLPAAVGAIFNHGIDVIIIPELCSGCGEVPRPGARSTASTTTRSGRPPPRTGGRSPPPTTPTADPQTMTVTADRSSRRRALLRDGGRTARSVLHGFTGNPSSMRGVAEALAAAGFAVELPLLPGPRHDGRGHDRRPVERLVGAAEEAYSELAGRCEPVVVVGLSMGGALTLWPGGRPPGDRRASSSSTRSSTAAGRACASACSQLLDEGTETMDGIGSDIADPDAVELRLPADAACVRCSRCSRPPTGFAGAARQDRLPGARDDEPAGPRGAAGEQRHHRRGAVSGPVERVTLERSYHVATQDYDKDLIEASDRRVRPPGHRRRPSLGLPASDAETGRGVRGRPTMSR